MASISINPNHTAAGGKVPQQIDIRRNDEVENEFSYYVALVHQIMLPMAEEERKRIARWIHFLVNPLNAAQPLELREKRNRYLFVICCGLLTGNVNAFLKVAKARHLRADKSKKSKFAKVAGTRIGGSQAPHTPMIADEHGFPLSLAAAINPTKLTTLDNVFERAEWQNCRFWERRLQNAKEAEVAMAKSMSRRVPALAKGKSVKVSCSVHTGECPQDLLNSKVGACLDRQFEYLVALAECYKNIFRNDAVKVNHINLWLQALARVDVSHCAHMKGIRNDYITVLIGYLVNGELRGPFEELPAANLPPLTEAIATYIARRKIEASDKSRVPLNPAGNTIESFMNGVPTIEEGAFALLSLSGNFFSSKPTL